MVNLSVPLLFRTRVYRNGAPTWPMFDLAHPSTLSCVIGALHRDAADNARYPRCAGRSNASLVTNGQIRMRIGAGGILKIGLARRLLGKTAATNVRRDLETCDRGQVPNSCEIELTR